MTAGIPVPYTTTTPTTRLATIGVLGLLYNYLSQMASAVVGNGIDCYQGSRPFTKEKMASQMEKTS